MTETKELEMKTLTKIAAVALLSATALTAGAQTVERTAGILASCSAHFDVLSQLTARDNSDDGRRATIGYRKYSEDFMRAARRTGAPDLDTARTLGNANALMLANQQDWNRMNDRGRECIMLAKTGPIPVDGIARVR